MAILSQPFNPPAWYANIRVSPLFPGKRIVAVDTNAIIHYLDETPLNQDVQFLIESPPSQLVLKLGRQVINETLRACQAAHPGRRWKSVQSLWHSHKVLLFGNAMLPEADRNVLNELQKLLHDTNVSEKDSWVIADSVVYRVLLFTREIRLKRAVASALNNPKVKRFLIEHRLANSSSDILVDVPIVQM